MFKMYLANDNAAKRLVDMCCKYHEDYEADFDVICGKYTVDGCSIVGVCGLIGREVEVRWNNETLPSTFISSLTTIQEEEKPLK